MSPFVEGYRTGLHWTNTWRPCGPPRCTDTICMVQSLEYIQAWLQGFDAGVARQKETADDTRKDIHITN